MTTLIDQIYSARARLQAAGAVASQLIDSLPTTKDPELYQALSHIGHLAVAVELLVKDADSIVEQLDRPQ